MFTKSNSIALSHDLKSWKISTMVYQLSLLCCIYIFTTIVTQAQTVSDFQTWYGASLKLDLKKGWAVTTQYRTRIIQDASYYKGSYLFENVDYRINDYLEISANYRLAVIDVGTFNRFAFAVEGRYRLRKFTASFRPMIQYQHQNFNSDYGAKTDNNIYLRTRLEFKYDISRRWTANLYVEPFLKLDKKVAIDWWQNSLGVKYEFSKGMKVNLYYIWVPDYTHKKYHVYNIVGLELDFTIKV